MRRYFFTGCCLLLAAGQLKAQKGINSLYSAFGIGDLEAKDYSRNFGVGSSGIARSSAEFLNELNPASYTGLPMETFFFEASLAGKSINYHRTGDRQPAGDVNFKKLAIGFKAHEKWGIGFGLMPYSRVDYKLLNTRYVEGTSTGVRNAVEGTGGINRLYFSNAVQLGKHLSLGLSSALLFGSVNVTDSLGSTGMETDIYTEQRRFMHNFNLTGGLQYKAGIGKWTLGAGLTYALQSKLTSSQTFSIRMADETVLFEEDKTSRDYSIPQQFGAGLSLTNGSVTWLADYRQQQWKGLNEEKGDYRYDQSHRLSGGVEYSFFKYYYNQRIEGLALQAGVNYHTGYIRVQHQPLRDFGITAGASLPNRTGQLRYYLGLEVGQRGSTANGLVQENYLNVVLHISLRDNWFFRRLEL